MAGIQGIDIKEIKKMVYEENRLNSFFENKRWPYMEDCNCTPEKMASAGFYWCGSDSQPDLVRCFVCLKEMEDWEANDNPWEEHKRLGDDCQFAKAGKLQDKYTVREVLKLCEENLKKSIEKTIDLQREQYNADAKNAREVLLLLEDDNNFEITD